MLEREREGIFCTFFVPMWVFYSAASPSYPPPPPPPEKKLIKLSRSSRKASSDGVVPRRLD